MLEAADGVEAMRHLEAGRRGAVRLGLIVLDLTLPRADGLTVLEYLGQQGLRVPVVVVSADERRWADALSAGAATIVPKPFDPAALGALVARYCPPPAASAMDG